MRKNLIIFLLLLTACQNALDLRPKMQISSDEAFSTKENIQAALLGCYDALQLQHYYGRNLIIIGDLASDNSFADGTKVEYYNVDDNMLLSDDILVEGIWADIYVAINRVNYMLYKLEDVTFLPEYEMADLRGQLRFLRGLHYYNLVRLYGGVPLKLLPTLDDSPTNFLPRSTEQAVYEQIVTDLEFASQKITNHLPQYATANAANALLASVALTRGQYPQALQFANAVLASSYHLESAYSQLFAAGTEPSLEIIFYVPFNASDKNRLAEYNFPYQLGGRHENAPTAALTSVAEEDLRKPMIASTYGDLFYSRKYADIATGSDKVIILRNAELLFIRAEALYRIDSVANLYDILSDVNVVRQRAGLTPVLADTITSCWNILQREKQIEFAFEGKRWFDLIRTNEAIKYVPSVQMSWQLHWPIPLSEIAANPNISQADQNEGY